jgi:hypothetical protein
MIKKITYTLAVLFVMFGMLGVAAPAYALGNSRIRALKGTIVALNSKTHTLTVAPLHGPKVTVRVAKGTLIKRNGKADKFAKLRVGDRTSLRYNPLNHQADEVDDTPGKYDIHGTVEAVDTTANTITIASEEGGNSVILNVDSATVILRNGATAALADLAVGDKVEAKYDSASMLASLIKTEVEDGEFQGTIAAVDTTANTVTITPAGGGADVVLSVVASTVIISHHTVITLADLHAGDAVQAEYDSTTLVASKIEVDDSSSGK